MKPPPMLVILSRHKRQKTIIPYLRDVHVRARNVRWYDHVTKYSMSKKITNVNFVLSTSCAVWYNTIGIEFHLQFFFVGQHYYSVCTSALPNLHGGYSHMISSKS